MDKKKIAALVALWLVLFAVMYVRPLPFEQVVPGFFDAPITACEGSFHTVAAGEDGKPVYRDVTKRFEVGSADYEDLLDLLRSESYRQQLSAVLMGGHRQQQSLPHPRAELYFTQGEKVFEIGVYTKYLALGERGALRDVTPKSGKTFHGTLMAFVRDRGETVSEEIRDYSQKG